MKKAYQYGLMTLAIFLTFIKDIARGTYAFLMFPIIIPVFILCILGSIILLDEDEKPPSFEDDPWGEFCYYFDPPDKSLKRDGNTDE